jgi:hypothetical protein
MSNENESSQEKKQLGDKIFGAHNNPLTIIPIRKVMISTLATLCWREVMMRKNICIVKN